MKKIRQNLQRKLNEMDAGITVDQWVVLDELQQKNGLSQNEIADCTFKDAPTVTRIIDLLCKKGLTERSMDENDRRRFKIMLTEEGKAKVKEVLPVVIDVRQQGWDGLGEEDHHNLIRILDTIFENYQ
ncbi:MAG: MarR family transcriptional regulator [Flammeovirgaceae bacterium]|nr:MarR family transcriptional regulator [Flammeovirgaceae bacterium]